jgi:hypothetical protein
MKFDGHSELLKAAPKRLRDAQELLEAPSRDPRAADAAYRHLCAAHYLAGYAVECALKTYVILLLDSRLPDHVTRWSHVVQHFAERRVTDLSGRHSHDLGRLLAVSGLSAAVDQDEQAKQTWGMCGKWDYNVRYRPQPLTDRARVEAFVEACSTIYRWIRARLPFSD